MIMMMLWSQVQIMVTTPVEQRVVGIPESWEADRREWWRGSRDTCHLIAAGPNNSVVWAHKQNRFNLQLVLKSKSDVS